MQTRGNQGNYRRFLEPKITKNEVVLFTQQLSFMIEEGLPLIRSLEALSEQEKNPPLKRMIESIIEAVNTGESFSEACKAYEDVLSTFFVSMMMASEQGVSLAVVTKRVAVHMEKEKELNAKVKAAFTYPMVVGSFCAIIVTFLIVFIAPVFAKVYSQMGATLPLPTQILMGISASVRQYWMLFMALIFGGMFFMVHPSTADTRKSLKHGIIKRLPLLGEISKKVAIAKFIRTFSSMLVCHVSVLESLTVSDQVVNHPVISGIIQKMKTEIEGGVGVTESIKGSNIFSPMIIQMVNVGEQSGNIGELLEKCANALEKEVDTIAKKALLIIEPVLTVGVALIVGFIALAIYLPMFDMMGHVS